MRVFIASLGVVLAILALLPSLSDCKQKSELRIAKELQGLYDQLNESCLSAITYEKRVIDLNVSPSRHQDSVLSLATTDTLLCPISRELIYAYSQYFAQEGLGEYFDTRTSGDTLIAELKSGYQSSIELQMQKILRAGEQFVYFESRSSKKNWLYELDQHLKLSFDEKGQYMRHSLDIYNAVPMLKEEFSSRIEGKARY